MGLRLYWGIFLDSTINNITVKMSLTQSRSRIETIQPWGQGLLADSHVVIQRAL